jgi:hypothetical protein
MMPVATSAIGEISKDASPTIIIDGIGLYSELCHRSLLFWLPFWLCKRTAAATARERQSCDWLSSAKVRFMAGVLSSSLTPL